MFCFVNGIPPGYSTLCGVSKHIVVKSKSIECAQRIWGNTQFSLKSLTLATGTRYKIYFLPTSDPKAFWVGTCILNISYLCTYMYKNNQF